MKRHEPQPHVYFVFSAIFHYLGPAFAVLLFARVEVLGVAWLPAMLIAAVGVVVLAQLPSAAELAGVALVIAGVAAHRSPQDEPAPLNEHDPDREIRAVGASS